jgi:uncharacterized membrane protein YccC
MMNTTTIQRQMAFAGFPGESWAFAIRIWLAIVLALYVSFWLELDAPSSAAITVAILALPTRAQGLDKAVFRLIATFLGVVASIAIVGVFAQSGSVILWVFAAWIGLCVLAAGMLDGNRAYAASLGVSTVAIVAIEQIDVPQNVFEAGIARGSAIAIGVLAIALVNDILGAPDHYPRIFARLQSLQGRIADLGRCAQRGQPIAAGVVAGLLQEITALRPDVGSLATESSSGPARSASARVAMVGLVAELATVRALDSVSGQLRPAGEHGGAPSEAISPDENLIDMARSWLKTKLVHREAEIRDNFTCLRTASYPRQSWRAPLYRSRRIALESGMRAAFYFALASTLFGLADWPAITAALAFVAILIGLSATAPDVGAFTKLAVLIAPFACLLAGILQFVVLDGATGFPMLAIGLAPFIMGCALLMTLANPILSSIGRLNMVFIIALVAPSNPQNYNPESFLFACLFVCIATLTLFAFQFVVPPMSQARQVARLLLEARQDLGRPQAEWRRDLATEEAGFRDALRVGQIAALVGSPPRDPRALDEAVRIFDQASALRQCRDELDSLKGETFADVAKGARAALARRDASALLDSATALYLIALERGALPPSACPALVVAGLAFMRPAPSAAANGGPEP